ncbi:MAG: hypothetical protein KDA63_16245, partial [Planctomycetales bacterium]|nr:hypothetical protein [Planctomycetales bacterium]
ALYITGPPRSSKGTLMHLMRDLVGLDNVHDASVANLADRFGLEPLAGKPLAIISDARFASRDTQPVIENLLRIIGGDGVSIQRKGRTNIETILPTRFVIASNEVPKLPDASTAIITRFLFLRTRKSFLGQEDPDLLNKLRRGLPGIFNWSREGWLDLKKQRRFMEPEATKRDRRLAEFLASDVRSFFDEMCVVEMGTSVPCSELYGEFVHWCEQAGIHNPPPANVFGQRLHAAVPIVETKQSTDGREYINIDMRKWATLE